MGHDVVQLPRDPGALGRDGLPSFSPPARAAVAHCAPSMSAPDRGAAGWPACRPRTADECQREGDVPAFWSGLPLVLGVAGALLGYAGRNAASGARLSIAAFVVGLLSSIGYVAIYVIDFLGQSGVG